jgi:hypothetical protein
MSASQLPAYVRMLRVRAAKIVAIDLPPVESGYRMAVLTLGLPDGGIVSERMPVTFLEARGVELNGYFLRHESGLADYRSSAEFEAEYSRAPNPVQVKNMEELETLLSMRTPLPTIDPAVLTVTLPIKE